MDSEYEAILGIRKTLCKMLGVIQALTLVLRKWEFVSSRTPRVT